ncbi:MAG TPA: antibiotic biosynthesis monooxygenase [Steroidobacteraceae bacterium]|jgi:heme-degrading monooxygenase HmoA
MFSVLFEVNIRSGRKDDYLALAKHLKPLLEAVDGFVDNERFESEKRPGWLLSHSTWRDEKSVVRWRTVGEHHHVQEQGRSEIFQDYHLHVGDVIHDDVPSASAPVREMRFDATEAGAGRYVTFVEVTPAEQALDPKQLPETLGLPQDSPDLSGVDVWKSIYKPGKAAVTAGWRTKAAAKAWRPKPIQGAKLRHRIVRIVRDYGMFDRREAPQFYEERPH